MDKLPAVNQSLVDRMEILLAIELLEYHDMNYLTGDNKTRSEKKMLIIRDCIEMVGKLQLC